jgi:winged helix DNA-binding protein
LTIYAELEGILCSGPRHGKQMTYASLSARAARTSSFTRDEAIAALTMRYFRSHGPATARDFSWWSGLMSADVKRGLDIVRARATTVDGLTYWSVGEATRRRKSGGVQLLPNYDEYLVAYRDLAAVPRKAGVRGILQRALIINGEIAGTWKAEEPQGQCTIAVEPYRRLTKAERFQLPGAFTRYQRFIRQPTR